MTKYDFTTLPNRLTHHTYKWKETETDPEIIPAWIADMDFNVIPEVREAVIGCRPNGLWLHLCIG